jgi:acetate kinase
MGLKLDTAKNDVRGVETKISSDDSKVLAYIIPTDEEMVIARDTKAIVEGLKI